MRRIGILEMASPDKDRLGYWRILTDAMGGQGHVENRDFSIEYHWAHGQQERLAGAAKELVDSAVDPCRGAPFQGCRCGAYVTCKN